MPARGIPGFSGVPAIQAFSQMPPNAVTASMSVGPPMTADRLSAFVTQMTSMPMSSHTKRLDHPNSILTSQIEKKIEEIKASGVTTLPKETIQPSLLPTSSFPTKSKHVIPIKLNFRNPNALNEIKPSQTPLNKEHFDSSTRSEKSKPVTPLLFQRGDNLASVSEKVLTQSRQSRFENLASHCVPG
jgi:hypothetical protein